MCNRNWFNCKLNQLRCHCDISLLVYIKEVYKQTHGCNWDTHETYLGVYVRSTTSAEATVKQFTRWRRLVPPPPVRSYLFLFFGRESNTAGTGTATYSSYVYFNVISDGGTHRDIKPKILLAPPLNSNVIEHCRVCTLLYLCLQVNVAAGHPWWQNVICSRDTVSHVP